MVNSQDFRMRAGGQDLLGLRVQLSLRWEPHQDSMQSSASGSQNKADPCKGTAKGCTGCNCHPVMRVSHIPEGIR